MLNECNIEKICVNDVKVILAAIDFYAKDIVSKQKNKMIKFKREDSLVEELKGLKEKIECSETDSGITVRESIAIKEEQLYKELLKVGSTEEELQNAFMYKELFGKIIR